MSLITNVFPIGTTTWQAVWQEMDRFWYLWRGVEFGCHEYKILWMRHACPPVEQPDGGFMPGTIARHRPFGRVSLPENRGAYGTYPTEAAVEAIWQCLLDDLAPLLALALVL